MNRPALKKNMEEEGWPILWENESRNQTQITQKRDKNSLVQHQNTTPHLRAGYKCKKGKGKRTLPLSKDRLQQLHVSGCMLLLLCPFFTEY
jgi:hypothetical protein